VWSSLFQLAELEGRNKELSKERDRLFRELDKTRKDLVKAKAKADTEKPKKDAEKGKKDAKRKQSDKGATSPEPSETSKALEGTTAEEEQLRAQLLSENDVSEKNYTTPSRHCTPIWINHIAGKEMKKVGLYQGKSFNGFAFTDLAN